MTDVLRVVEHVVDPPRSLAVELIGLRTSINRCGGWPDAGTVDDYNAGVGLAGRELDRIDNIWRRYARRFGLAGAEIEDGPARLAARHHVVRQIYDQRAEHSGLLIRDPIAGCA
jgi:hypothetical protein